MQVVIEDIRQLFCPRCTEKYVVGPHKLFYLSITEVSYNEAIRCLTANNMLALLDIYDKLIILKGYECASISDHYIFCGNHGTGNNIFPYISCANCLYYFRRLHLTKNLNFEYNRQINIPDHICNKANMKQSVNKLYRCDDNELIEYIFSNAIVKNARSCYNE